MLKSKYTTILLFLFVTLGYSQQQLGDPIFGEDFQQLGSTAALSSSANVLLVGGLNNGQGGVINKYSYDGSQWIQDAVLINNTTPLSDLGRTLSMTQDGMHFITSNYNSLFQTVIQVYGLNGSTISQIGNDIIFPNYYVEYGSSLAINSDATVIAVGAPEDSEGSVYIYSKISEQWELTDKINGEISSSQFGYSIDLSADGSIIAIGAKDADINGNIFNG